MKRRGANLVIDGATSYCSSTRRAADEIEEPRSRHLPLVVRTQQGILLKPQRNRTSGGRKLKITYIFTFQPNNMSPRQYSMRMNYYYLHTSQECAQKIHIISLLSGEISRKINFPALSCSSTSCRARAPWKDGDLEEEDED